MTSRTDAGLAALHDRNPLFTRLSDGSIRNGYEPRIANEASRARQFRLELAGLDGRIEAVGADQTREARVLASTSKAPEAGAAPVTFRLVDLDGHVAAEAKDFFRSGAQ